MQIDQSIAKRWRLTISHTAIMSHGWWAAILSCARTTRNVTRPTVGRPLGAIRLRRLAMIAMHVIARVSEATDHQIAVRCRTAIPLSCHA